MLINEKLYFNVFNLIYPDIESEMKLSILDCLKKDLEMKTKDIITMVSEDWEGRIVPSPRSVQRVRKSIKDIKNVFDNKLHEKEYPSYPKTDENDLNVWVKSAYEYLKKKENQKGEDMRIKGMHEWQIDLLNLANQGGWSIQQLATKMDLELVAVMDTLTTYHFMVHTQVLDEDDESVYFQPNVDFVAKDEFNTDDPNPEPVSEPEPTGGNDSFWEVEIDCVSECSKVEKTVDVFMNLVSRKKAMLFMKWAKDREWLAYLVGEFKNGKYHVTDLYVPDQRTCATLVDKVEAKEYNEKSIVGVIHSHHEMGAGDADNPSFSGHDTAFINGNHNLSLLAGRDKSTKGFKIVGIARAKTPCGALMKIKANVKPMPEKLEGEKDLKKEFFTKCFDDNRGGKTYDVHK